MSMETSFTAEAKLGAAQISGARVKLSDAPRGVTERCLRLSGQPAQVQAAVNLVQAFLLTGNAGGLEARPHAPYR